MAQDCLDSRAFTAVELSPTRILVRLAVWFKTIHMHWRMIRDNAYKDIHMLSAKSGAGDQISLKHVRLLATLERGLCNRGSARDVLSKTITFPAYTKVGKSADLLPRLSRP